MEINSETLRKIRDQKGFSQKEFADFLGISTRSYQDYEGGKNIPDAKKLLILTRLGVKNADLKGAEKSKTPREVRFEDVISNKIMEDLQPSLNEVNQKLDALIELMTSIDVSQDQLKEKLNATHKDVLKQK